MRTSIVALVALVSAAPLAAQQSRVTLDPTSTIEINGTSNVHNWECKAPKFESAIEVAPTKATELGSSVKAITVTIPVAAIDCGKGGMNKNLQKAMNADKNPTVRFRMTSYKAAPAAGAYAAVIGGDLTINGVEKPVELKATLTPDGKGGVKAVGSTQLTTTDFGVQPVSALFGSIKTGPVVTIKYDLRGTAASLVAQLPQQ